MQTLCLAMKNFVTIGAMLISALLVSSANSSPELAMDHKLPPDRYDYLWVAAAWRWGISQLEEPSEKADLKRALSVPLIRA